jgi:hypothetical protein
VASGARHRVHLGELREPGCEDRSRPPKPTLFGVDDDVGAHPVVTISSIDAFTDAAMIVMKPDQPDADRERARGRRGSLRAPRGVVAGQLAGTPRSRAMGRAERAG